MRVTVAITSLIFNFKENGLEKEKYFKMWQQLGEDTKETLFGVFKCDKMAELCLNEKKSYAPSRHLANVF